jgi:heat shock protein HtpX
VRSAHDHQYMKRKVVGRDLPLSAAMGVAILVLGALYLAALAVPLWLHSIGLLGLAWALILDVALLALFGLQYASLDWAALRAARARFVAHAEAPDLHNSVERLCALAELPKPRVAVVDSDVPDAFATGRNPARSTVAVTTGLLQRLEAREVEAVLAHELTHVANRDGAVMTFASFPALSLREAISEASWKMWTFGLPLMLLAFLVYGISTGLMLTVSRCREYAADRGATIITGTPEYLMSALQKIAGVMPQIPEADLRSVTTMSAFFIVPPNLRSLTHPSLERRLERLSEMSRELGEPVAPAAASPRRARLVNLCFGIGAFVVVFAAIVLVGTR